MDRLERRQIRSGSGFGSSGGSGIDCPDCFCCAKAGRDSSRKSGVVAVVNEPTHTAELQDQELASL
ncbi:hypothetical protein, partial [Puniceibacterium confluentis]|uniref:hypothetical protein n=1 Tax=Puniceibacterium confluentis TaxID=1958944 RepID=UPI00356B1DEF